MKKTLAKQKQKILIVEDDNKVLNLLLRALSGKGYITMKAENGRQALRMAVRARPDLVILDLKLPDCNGIQILAELKAIDQTIQVIILTGYGSQEEIRNAMEMGAFDFFTKPFEIHELCAVIREALGDRPSIVSGESVCQMMVHT
jgi:DNA-binding NtrC family response regulator